MDFWISIEILKEIQGDDGRMTSRDISRDPISIDFLKKSMLSRFTIFNTKVLKIYDFRFPEKSKIIERLRLILILRTLGIKDSKNP